MVVSTTSEGSSGTQVLVLIDGSEESRTSALAAANLFASTPCATFTVLAPSNVASPDTDPGVNGAGPGLMQISRQTLRFLETVRLIEARGLRTSVRTTDGSLLAEAAKIADAHTALVLPKRHAGFAGDFPVPVLMTP